jgi:hypothetical protein
VIDEFGVGLALISPVIIYLFWRRRNQVEAADADAAAEDGRIGTCGIAPAGECTIWRQTTMYLKKRIERHPVLSYFTIKKARSCARSGRTATPRCAVRLRTGLLGRVRQARRPKQDHNEDCPHHDYDAHDHRNRALSRGGCSHKVECSVP